ncbi:alpha-D-glucose phosphate-specific phosphoglucomutase [Prochlorococcus sp. MIT 1341]|uniref:alpha-D-glucose phosphate-specific phosphoglucomutase n=1 Tax=Prochlorococcus sp. MIT 1341 TaxID=3096221 RepID=UPI002A763A48|nr:alpha-D-glucose phosphate-specific phosphoglucomutase [Prochlorococcus sp. MIT 1341]
MKTPEEATTLQRTVKLKASFEDQKPGTSGLRKSICKFSEPHYLESFIEAIFQTLPNVKGGTLVLGGDGRYGNEKAIQTILKIGAAHNLDRIITTTNGILSTPAASNLIRNRKAIGGIILSASHNPGGPDGDFGVKVNGANGGPASESLTNSIYSCTKELNEYIFLESPNVSINAQGEKPLGGMIVEVIDGVEDYVMLMKKLFNFESIKQLLNDDFTLIFDAMNAVTGPYAHRLLEQLLKAPQGTVINGLPLEDFGGCHPDPNLTYASGLAELLLKKKKYSFGAACDGDGDRNMILGKGCFVNPSDSLAVITANAHFIPGYANGIKGVARSMPTSSAVDAVAKDLGINCFETPTGWKFFGNLLDANMITLCGEESFGTGSNHVREKDGLWAVLCWLQILSKRRLSVAEIMKDHWQKYGRHYYSRHDYEGVESNVAIALFDRLEKLLPTLIGNQFAGSIVKIADNFAYTDPIDKSVSKNQGLRIILEDNSRLIIRMSGTGTKGATLRVYLESYVATGGRLDLDPQEALKPLINEINSLAEIEERTGMKKPTVIT